MTKAHISVDTGGTFTDVLVATPDGRMVVGKALTTPERIFDGMHRALELAAGQLNLSPHALLESADSLLYGTTRATNAIVQGTTAKTALLVTEGFPDILVLKEGGKFDPHDYTHDYPPPYIPRRHTFEVCERIGADGGVVTPLDREGLKETLRTIKARGFEAVAVCFIWSVANATHEIEVGRLIEEMLPGVPYTLSHRLLPIMREYRRASTAAIDASLKPLMQCHFADMEADLRAAGFQGELLISSLMGGCMRVEDAIDAPVQTVKSGPAMAPVAAAKIAGAVNPIKDLVVCDTGGTTFDVSLLRDGSIVASRETWLGKRWVGNLISLAGVDVRSVGAGGGSIAWVDEGGLLRVGPQSAGSNPGPACYGRGGSVATVTDAALLLGYLDPAYFAGGRLPLDTKAATCAVQKIADSLGCTLVEAAYAILHLSSETMLKAIHEITVNEGLDPRESLIVAGGGAGGLNLLAVAREMGCPTVVVPRLAGALSACGMQFTDILTEETVSAPISSDRFDSAVPVRALQVIDEKLAAFSARFDERSESAPRVISYLVEARYRSQIWDLEVPVSKESLDGTTLVQAFHKAHERVFSVFDPDGVVEFLNWRGRMAIERKKPELPYRPDGNVCSPKPHSMREASMDGKNRESVPIYRGDDLTPGMVLEGPAIIEEETSTLVILPGMKACVTNHDSYLVEVGV